MVKVCNRNDDNYRFGFNGQEKDNEIKGIGNSLDFGARIHDSRLGRWLSIDPLQAKYPSASTYNFTLNNPIMNRDPDGRDVEVAITRNPAGGGSIVLKSEVYVSGVNSAAIVNSSQKTFDNWKNKGGTYTDEHGKKWKVEVQMVFKVATSDDIERIKNTAAESAGENLLMADLPVGGRAYAGVQGNNYNKTRAGKFRGSGNQGHITPNDGGRTTIHENFHLLGLGDRYSDVTYEMTQNGESLGRTNAFSKDHVDFEGDIMSSGWGMSQVHINNLGSAALELSEEKKSDNFIMGRKVDDADSKQVDKVPESFESGNVEYSDPQYEKAK